MGLKEDDLRSGGHQPAEACYIFKPVKEASVGLVAIILCSLLIGCKSDSEKARLMLNEAHTLLRQEKPDEAKKELNDLVEKFGHTE